MNFLGTNTYDRTAKRVSGVTLDELATEVSTKRLKLSPLDTVPVAVNGEQVLFTTQRGGGLYLVNDTGAVTDYTDPVSRQEQEIENLAVLAAGNAYTDTAVDNAKTDLATLIVASETDANLYTNARVEESKSYLLNSMNDLENQQTVNLASVSTDLTAQLSATQQASTTYTDNSVAEAKTDLTTRIGVSQAISEIYTDNRVSASQTLLQTNLDAVSVQKDSAISASLATSQLYTDTSVSASSTDLVSQITASQQASTLYTNNTVDASQTTLQTNFDTVTAQTKLDTSLEIKQEIAKHIEIIGDGGGTPLVPAVAAYDMPVMTGPTTADGEYTVSSGTFFNNNPLAAAWKAFDHIAANRWTSNYGYNASGFPSSVGYPVTPSLFLLGDYLKVSCATPRGVRGLNIQIDPNNDPNSQRPTSWQAWVSDDDVTYKLVGQRVRDSVLYTFEEHLFDQTVSGKYFVVIMTTSAGQLVSVTQLNWLGRSIAGSGGGIIGSYKRIVDDLQVTGNLEVQQGVVVAGLITAPSLDIPEGTLSLGALSATTSIQGNLLIEPTTVDLGFRTVTCGGIIQDTSKNAWAMVRKKDNMRLEANFIVPTPSPFVAYTLFDEFLFHNAVTSNSGITFTEAGFYRVSGSFNIVADKAGPFCLGIYSNELELSCQRIANTGGMSLEASENLIHYMNAGDVLSFRVGSNDTAGQTVALIIKYAAITVEKLDMNN